MNTQIKETFKFAFPRTFPVLTGFLVMGIAYGVLMASKGYSPFWILLISATALCGSMQFVAIPFFAGMFAPMQVFLLSLMVNARHFFYGLSMLEKYKGTGKAKAFLIFGLCDETFAINASTKLPDHIDKKMFYLMVTFLNWLYWTVSSFIGGLVANFFTIETKGLDFALTALFIVLFLEQVKSKQSMSYGLIGIASALVSLYFFGADNMVIPAMILILVILLGRRKTVCN